MQNREGIRGVLLVDMEESPSERFQSRRSRYLQHRSVSFILFAVGLFVGIGISQGVDFAIGNDKSSIQQRTFEVAAHSPCGSDAKTAQANGCIFEVLSFAWLPPECHDHEAEKDFLASGNWSWFAHTPGVSADSLRDLPLGGLPPLPPLSLDQIRQGTHHGVHVTWGYHVTHCTYIWQKMHRALLRGKFVDSYMMEMEHTKHCSRRFLESATGKLDEDTGLIVGPPPEWESWVTQLALKFPSCQEAFLFA